MGAAVADLKSGRDFFYMNNPIMVLTQADVKASSIIVNLAKYNSKIEKFSLSKYNKID